jgi:hypothetical protein
MPQDDYYFFFSYASENHKNASKWGESGNYLDEFFEQLCKRVSDKSKPARNASQVAYHDRKRLKIGDFWDQVLIEGLQKSRVVVALLSPHYLDSESCGRELALVQRRWEEYVRTAEAPEATAHRILPLYWEDSTCCSRNRSAKIMAFFRGLQGTQEGMPGNYPVKGLSQLCRLCEYKDLESLCEVFASRIVELAEHPNLLPVLPDPGDFMELESLYSRLTRQAEGPKVASGPESANVMYLVGTRREMETVEAVEAVKYGSVREDWLPFAEAPGATVGLLTQEGANQVGVRRLNNLGSPDDLLPLIEAAKQHNSPVLLVLDHQALSLPHLVSKLKDYDSINFPHCGLVTAGGKETLHDEVVKIFPYKALTGYPNHYWTIPADRGRYVAAVVSVLRNLRGWLMRTAQPVTGLTGSSMPGLAAPPGN